MSVAFYLHDVGKVLVDENNLNNLFAQNIVACHHGPLYHGEKDCYPDHKTCAEIPPYVKICKLADIYDARTSKHCYKEAQNPADVMADIFNSYVNKDKDLQLILHSFVNVIGICPPGSIVFLSNGQLAYVIDSCGPLLIPITDTNGITLSKSLEPVDLSKKQNLEELTVDRKVPITFPIEVYNKLPAYLRTTVQ